MGPGAGPEAREGHSQHLKYTIVKTVDSDLQIYCYFLYETAWILLLGLPF